MRLKLHDYVEKRRMKKVAKYWSRITQRDLAEESTDPPPVTPPLPEAAPSELYLLRQLK